MCHLYASSILATINAHHAVPYGLSTAQHMLASGLAPGFRAAPNPQRCVPVQCYLYGWAGRTCAM